MGNLSQRNKRVINEHYALVPRTDVPRATFNRPHEHKLTCTGGALIPILVDEVLPGDVHSGEAVIFARLADLIFPLMDTVTVETQFFFVPMRILWANAKKFWGEQAQPTSSISYLIPIVHVDNADAYPGSIYDYMGIPANLGSGKDINALPFRAYNLIWNEWYRDQNIQNSLVVDTDDGPDTVGNYTIVRRNKKHDYFTSALPQPQKGDPVSLPLGTEAPIRGLGVAVNTLAASPNPGVNVYETGPVSATYADAVGSQSSATLPIYAQLEMVGIGDTFAPRIYADLTDATAATINQLRLAVQTQKLLEGDARGGTRYVEQLRHRWGVTPQDARLQRPEYIGGGVTQANVTAIAQTAPAEDSPLGSLAGQGTVVGGHRFTCIGHEHGYLIGLMSIMTKPSYQQGINRLFTRSTRYDFATPEFVGLGEQAIRNDELYVQGTAADEDAFGYQERYGEYRFSYNRISGLFRSTAAGNIDEWHLAQQFGSLPTLSSTFIQENAPFERVLAGGETVELMELLCDIYFKIKSTRPLPAYGIPGGVRGSF